MQASSTVVRRIQSQPGYALISILMELVVSGCRAIARWSGAVSERRRQAEVRTELRRLSDRALKDIGLERGEIEGLFR